MSAPAKYSPPRDETLATIGPQVAVVSAALGHPFMPWQDQVANTAGELHPTRPGEYRYKTVVLTVPRQAGKTTLLQAVKVHRALVRPRTAVWMTAQTGKDARKRWRDLVETVTDRSSPLRSKVKPYKAGGAERLDFVNGSFIAPFAPVPKSMHGETPPLVTLDEVWAYDQAQGDALMAAIPGSQIAVPDRQLWIVTTMGSQFSHWWNALVTKHRHNTSDDTAYFEWSADEALAETDPAGDDTLSFHPAVGHTQRIEDLRAEHDREPNPANYRRSFLNLTTATDNTIADLAAFDRLVTEGDAAPPRGSLVLGYAVAEQRAGGAIWGAWDDAGTTRLVTLATDTGAAWIVPAVLQLVAAHSPQVVAANDTPATRTVTDEIARAGVSVKPVAARDYATHCTDLLGRIKDGRLGHDAGGPEPGDPLRDALAVAGLGPVAGGLGFTERHSRGPIESAQAAAIAAGEVPRAGGIQLW